MAEERKVKEPIKLRKELIDAGVKLTGTFYSPKFAVNGKDYDLSTLSVASAVNLAKGKLTRVLEMKDSEESPQQKPPPKKAAPQTSGESKK